MAEKPDVLTSRGPIKVISIAGEAKKGLILVIEEKDAEQRSSGGTEIVPPAEFLPASVIQYGRALHDSMALRKALSNKTQQFQIAASLPLLKP